MSTAAPVLPVTFADVADAATTLAGVAHRTPVLTSRTLDGLVGGRVFCKCESFQRTGAFKFRGGYNSVSRLTGEQRRQGVLTYSSGNHAQAIALASALTGAHAIIVMPSDAPRTKRSATAAYLECAAEGESGPSRVVEYDRATQVREQVGGELAERFGMTIIPPYDHPHVVAGQGTAGLELFEEAGQLDRLYVCVGGGGLLSGCSLAAAELSPACEVVGVEPATADDAKRSFETGTIQRVHEPQTIADGARTPSIGEIPFAIIKRHVADMLAVSDAELAAAMRLCYERLRIVIEPTGALALAGAIKDARERPDLVRDRRIGVVISGGNVDLPRLGEFFALASEPLV